FESCPLEAFEVSLLGSGLSSLSSLLASGALAPFVDPSPTIVKLPLGPWKISEPIDESMENFWSSSSALGLPFPGFELFFDILKTGVACEKSLKGTQQS